ncbi:MAG: TusE/DsrC/DsvC family sulfur relay protein [Thermoanaerobaculia bacterium]|jgi:sulfur relay (sulfurtransferase) DsrC/TusE family protein
MPQITVNPPTRRAEPDTSEWTPSLAECVARVYGIDPLSEPHWRVISECREEWARSGVVPEPDRLAALSHLSPAILKSLFPLGQLALAWILAGVVPPASLSLSPVGSTRSGSSGRAVNPVVHSAAPKPRGSS